MTQSIVQQAFSRPSSAIKIKLKSKKVQHVTNNRNTSFPVDPAISPKTNQVKHSFVNRRLTLALILTASSAFVLHSYFVSQALTYDSLSSTLIEPFVHFTSFAVKPNQSLFLFPIIREYDLQLNSSFTPFFYFVHSFSNLPVTSHSLLHNLFDNPSPFERPLTDWISFNITLTSCLLIAANLWFLYMCICNSLFMQDTCNPKPYPFTVKPKVTVLLAARNEENNIKACLESLLAQNYPDFEILVMNDDSTDRTSELLHEISTTHPNKDRLQVFNSSYLPADWYGKAYSVQQLAKHATGDVYIVTDADTVHQPNSLDFCVNSLFSHECDFISGFPHQELTSIGQQILVPSIYLMSTFLLPLWLVDQTHDDRFALAIGQLKVYRRQAFDCVDGYSSIRREICEDVQMARLLKRTGHRIKFIDAKAHVTCNMYSTYWQAFSGIAKTYFSALDHNVFNFAFAGVFVSLMISPWVLISIDYFILCKPISIVHLLNICIFLLGWSLALNQRNLSFHLSFYYPLMFLSLIANTLYAFYVRFVGKGFQWKDRLVK